MDETATKSVHHKMLYIQQALKVNKLRGKGHDANAQVTYEYRNAEDILEAVKPIAMKVEAYVRVVTEPFVIGENVATDIRVVGKDRYQNDVTAIMSGPRFGAKATAYLVDCNTGESVSSSSFAFIDWWRKGQTEPEKLCGSADSYATKYALQHLFALDNGRDDPDSNGEFGNGDTQQNKKPAAPSAAPSVSPQKPIRTTASTVDPAAAPKKPASGKASLFRQAWEMFLSLKSTEALTDHGKKKFFSVTLKKVVGNEDPHTLTPEEWGRVIAHFDGIAKEG